MLANRIEAKGDPPRSREVSALGGQIRRQTAGYLSETQSRALNFHLAELALLRMGAKHVHIIDVRPRATVNRADPFHRRQRGDPAAGASRDRA